MVLPQPRFRDAVYEITPADGCPASRANLQLVLFYRTPGNLRQQMSTRLREAFYRTMARYPIFYGRMERGGAGGASQAIARVVVDGSVSDECIPRYEDVDVETRVEDIQSAHYNWATWPPALLSVCPVRQPPAEGKADDPLVQCVVTWHADGMCFMISVDHWVVDGVGLNVVLNEWAQAMRDPQAVSNAEGDFDHASIYDSIRSCEPEPTLFVRYVDAVDLSKIKSASEAILSADPRSPREVELSLRSNVHSVRMTSESMERLRRDAMQESGLAGEERQVSRIRLAYALMWQRYMSAVQEDGVPDGTLGLLNVVHSARHLVDRPQYTGNCVCPVYMTRALGELTRMPLYQLADEIGKQIQNVSKPQWLAAVLMIQDPERYAKFITVFANPDSRQLTVSNISQSRLFDVDFGFGAPVHVTVYPMLIPGFSAWLPLTAAGGLHILWNMTAAVAARLKNDPVFTRYAELLF
ncbi:hypothetical protein IWQ57_002424 [Coemansia nantahalensis]|uniref:Uncharacterized protein n=1 Tax=Coemansia nantahalensis TaxID=2789366 RepID=A0ACC1K0U1_9FUNG|nr:hypothetical protein IWQ57_002424 [Coemansia nantahalensis]